MNIFIHSLAALLFAVALVHTFSTKHFERLARRGPAHAGLWRLLAEVEVVFGFWAAVLMLAMFAFTGRDETIGYLQSRDFTQPMFVFAIMVVACTRPVLQAAMVCVRAVAKVLPMPAQCSHFFLLLSLAPLLGSLITGPAAMTLAAFALRDRFFTGESSERLKYATLGALFVNISIGGVLTTFASPPVLMVAGTWGWDTGFMLANFGWKAILAVLVNALGATLLFRKELSRLPGEKILGEAESAPAALVIANLIFLLLLVVFAQFPVVFMGLFLLFLGVAQAYERSMGALILREGLLVACFLAGLVVLGGFQEWWLRPALLGMSSNAVYFGATALTAVTDNAALTYLASLVQGLSADFKYALVAGAVTGGGLTIIANAPNPAGIAILRGCFDEGSVNPFGLLIAALPPTIIAGLAFGYL
ncbi:MAG: putative Na+/H+ antiporter [Desulfovibrionaceae bacterium]|nr:putative Na+/H+ antiporter [Desulfovibrionaceae bacterium]MBF0512939.1 putative Na+/H+ antiporter [Desulfovibrionaceae bacterium]